MQKDLKGRSAAAILESEKTLGTRLTRVMRTRKRFFFLYTTQTLVSLIKDARVRVTSNKLPTAKSN